jgi:hypothetical protein
MAKTRSLLLRAEVRPAGKLSHCAHNRTHEICKGEHRFVVRDSGPAGGEKGYCADCAAQMLDASQTQVQDLRGALEDE